MPPAGRQAIWSILFRGDSVFPGSLIQEPKEGLELETSKSQHIAVCSEVGALTSQSFIFHSYIKCILKHQSHRVVEIK